MGPGNAARALLAVMALLLALAGCPPTDTPDANNDGTGDITPPAGTPADEPDENGDTTSPVSAPVTQENLTQFSNQLNDAVASAVRSVVDQAPPPTARVLSDGVRMRVDTLDDLLIAGHAGTARVNGFRSVYPLPARYELSFSLENYANSDALLLTGTLECSCVVDARSSPAIVHGLYRAVLTLGGDYSGRIDVRASVVDNAVRALAATSEGVQLTLNDRPPDSFITYVSTIAGTGSPGYQDGPAAQALFNYPTGIAVDDDGRIYVADSRNAAIREIDLDSMVSTVTTNVQEPYDIGLDSKGKLVVSDQLGGSHAVDESPLIRLVVRGEDRGSIVPLMLGGENPFSVFPLCPTYSCDGRPPLSAMPWPAGIDVRNQSVLVAQKALGAGLKLMLPDGYLMTVLDTDYPATTICDESRPGAPLDLVQGNNGEIYYVTDCHAVRVLETDGTVRTLAGRLQVHLEFADGVGDAARFAYPEGLVFDGERYLYVADSTNGLIRRVDVETAETVRVAGCLAHTPGFDCTSNSGFRDGPGDYAQFESPYNLALDRWGDLYVADARNNAIRLVRILADPDRTPNVHRFDPAVMQQGDSGTMKISGRNLTTILAIDLGAGVTATLERSGYQNVTANITVAPDAVPGPRQMTVTTSFGAFTTPAGLSFTVLADTRGGIRVETIAGTGSAEPDRLNYGPAQNTTFAFPGGIHAISSDRLLVADPLEQRIRLIATRVGAVEEFFELLTYAASGTGVDVLGGIIGIFDSIEHTLDFFGLGAGIVGQTEDTIRDIARQSVDEICNTIGVDDCTWLSLPWAGLPYVPGETNGFRLKATFFLPTDIWADPASFGVNSRFYIADSGNSTVRVVGHDIEQDQPAPMQVFSTDPQPDHPFAVTPENTSVYASLPSSLMLSQLSLNSGAVNGDYASIPRGVPLGIANYDGNAGTDDRSIFVADPLNATIWRVVNKGGVSEIKNIRGDVPSFVIGECVDGPATFATWGAPMDVAVDQTGTVYVADAGCNSIRVIKDAGFGQDLDGLIGSLREYVASNQSRISAAAAQRIEENLRLANTEFLDDNRFLVTTLAGSPDGQAGFADGPAALARFNSPTSIAISSTGEQKIVFVADTGNRRIRRIVIP